MKVAYLELPSLTKEQHEAVVAGGIDVLLEYIPGATTFQTLWEYDNHVWHTDTDGKEIQRCYQVEKSMARGHCAVVEAPETHAPTESPAPNTNMVPTETMLKALAIALHEQAAVKVV